jgi:hypothetical protein
MTTTFHFFPDRSDPPLIEQWGFRFGAVGAHTSRTMMSEELALLLDSVPLGATKTEIRAAIIDANCLGKPTASTRRLSYQRLSELYGLDRDVLLFRLLRRVWILPGVRHQLVAVLCALARDPLLRATAKPIVGLPTGAEYARSDIEEALQKVASDRLNNEILAKVGRNCASSWTQSGHLVGRTFKKRAMVEPEPGVLCFALALGFLAGFRGADLFATGWMRVLDCSPLAARQLATEAKRRGLIDLRISGEIIELRLERLDPALNQL